MRVSYSKLKCYEQCPAKFKFKYIDNLPEESGPAASRGTRIHSLLEDAIKGQARLPLDHPDPDHEVAEKYYDFCDTLRKVGAEAEIKLKVNQEFQPASQDVWITGIIDVLYVDYVNNQAKIWDWKTGKKYDEHVDQGNFYSMLTLAAFPEVEVVEPCFVYVDDRRNWPMEPVKRGMQFEALKQEYTTRIKWLDYAESYVPNPGWYCNYCSFAASKGGPCPFGN
jgi:RecB family exonuclease